MKNAGVLPVGKTHFYRDRCVGKNGWGSLASWGVTVGALPGPLPRWPL